MLKNTDPYKRRLTDRLEEGPTGNLDSFEDNSEEHVNEKWLISYADMMTLLFGLFVMLYTVAMDTQGHPEKVLSDIVTGKSSFKDSKENEIQILNKEKSDLTNQLNEQIKKTKGLSDENTQIKGVISQLEDKLQKTQKEQEQSQQEQVLGLKTEIQTLNSKLAGIFIKIEGFKSQVVSLKNENQGLLTEAKTNTDLIASLKSEIQNLLTEAKTNIDMLTLLKNENQGFRTDSKKISFMVVNLNWSTPQHDIDLRITDPHGRMFDFQNRSYKESKANFIADSRTGPGVEIWQTPEIEPGDYQIEFSFYNAYSNNAPAVMTGSIITRKGLFKLPEIKLNFKQDRKKIFKIQATESGTITILSP